MKDPFSEKSALESLVDELEESGVFDDATRVNQAELETNTEWTRREYTHVHSLMEAWAYGVLCGDSWFHGYRLVEHFDIVFNHISQRVQEKFGKEIVPQVSLIEIRQWLGEWAKECPEYLAWNERGGSGVVSRYTPTPSEAEFIDLDVPPHQAAIFLRDGRRHEKAFERRHRDEPIVPGGIPGLPSPGGGLEPI